MIKRTLSIRARVMVLSLLPMTLLALILGGYFTLTRVAEIREDLLERGQSMARLMSSAAEFGVLSGNRDLLRSLSNAPIANDEVADILFYDAKFRLLYRSNNFDIEVERDQLLPREFKGTWHFIQPITTRTPALQDNPELLQITDASETLGWVVVLISAQPTVQRQQEILLRGAGLTLICLFVTLLLANRFGRRITRPVMGLTRLIERLQRGELDARAEISYTGELRTLASGINRLAARVQESNQQFEYRVESATRRLTQTLRHLERRNRELQTERLRADDANRAKDEFLARMSHELRTPLTSVLGFTELLGQTTLDNEQKRYLEIITRTSGLLLTIIDDILDFSRLESNAIHIESLSFDFAESLFDVIEAQSPAAAGKGLELTVDLPTDLPLRLIGDPSRLSQILNNLIGNAVKFTERGEVSVKVELCRLPLTDPRLHITVSDTGIGIPASRISQLFSAFTQGDNSISRRFGGSGLGLVIAHRLTELMGGHITLDSAEGSGTEIQLDLPLRYGECSEKASCLELESDHQLMLFEPHFNNRATLLRQLRILPYPIQLIRHIEELSALTTQDPRCTILLSVSPKDTSSRSVQALCDRVRAQTQAPLILLIPGRKPLRLHVGQLSLMAKPPRPNELFKALGLPTPASQPVAEQDLSTAQLPYPLKVLVAEDNEFNSLLVRRLLEGVGAQVSCVASGQEVLDHVAHQTPDLILMDVHMPGMDGIQATRAVRERLPKLPIVALTANVVPHEHRALFDAGINDLLLKPINVPELVRTLLQQCEAITGQTIDASPIGAQLEASVETLATPEQLQQEVRRLSDVIMQALWQRDRDRIRSHAHQLIGMAGLYEMPILEAATAELYQAAREGSMRELWLACSRLCRIAQQDSLE
ncbi:sensor histidine kinase/response regulator [Marinobacterium lacunae]|uniref:histidine kinase n=1 Tax=Marinobacterium lacunae TaxID=1232683 RepID=A0A081G1C9_9GAMM|nr:hybrid sensor histidine kinase/response regulator [Marinobacterium lacunae]KEA64584.1 sensor histidine kinase/response regulator [Marinobacterium lacunae]